MYILHVTILQKMSVKWSLLRLRKTKLDLSEITYFINFILGFCEHFYSAPTNASDFLFLICVHLSLLKQVYFPQILPLLTQPEEII